MSNPVKPRLLNAESAGYSRAAREVLDSFAEVSERTLSQVELLQAIGDYELLIVRLGLVVNRELLEAAGRLQAVVTATTGLNHVDLDAAGERAVAVLSLRGEVDFLRTIPASSEHTWALLLALTRHLPAAFDSVRRGEWNRDAYKGRDLQGKRLGILGLGRIGERVAGFALAFGMGVIAYDPSRKGPWPTGVRAVSSLEELLGQAEVLSIHVPLTSATRRLIGLRELELLPNGAVLVNTSRGEVIDHEALVSVLSNGRLAGAALDVLPGEPFSSLKGHPIVDYARNHDNLILTPHLAGATWESMESTELFMARKLKRWWSDQSRHRPSNMRNDP